MLIELESEKEAKYIVENWDPSCFSCDNGSNNKTTATLLANKNLRCVVSDVDPDLSDDEVLDDINASLSSTGHIDIRRFVRNGRKLYTVMATFDDRKIYEDALNKGQILVGQSYCPITKYKPKPYVVQCFKCHKYDHTAKWCSQKTTYCGHCGLHSHDTENCDTHRDQKQDLLYCVNCDVKGKHSSLSKECPIYQKKLKYATTILNDC